MTRHYSRGQILVETAIALPITIFLVLGGLQLMLIQHGRVMTEYAAYCAARAGIVNDGNWNVMRNAALIAALPIYGRTDTLDTFEQTWLKTKTAAAMTNAVDTGVATLEQMGTALFGVNLGGLTQNISVVEVQVVSPDANAITTAQQWQQQKLMEAYSVDASAPLVFQTGEIEFDDEALALAHPETLRLALNVRVLYPLKIPVIGRLIFELYLLSAAFGGLQLSSTVPEWVQFNGEVNGYDMKQVAETADLSAVAVSSQWGLELATLREVANRYGVYLIPLRASYAMQMQSDFFNSNQREPTWFHP